jgi:ABC-2 type transport system ATP-binding protein
MTALLEVHELTRDFGAFRAVDALTFSVEAGQIVGFIGPNGAGKSTAMRILATLDAPTWGDARLHGKSIIDLPDQARPRLGYMPDRYGTYESMTVFEYLDFFGRAYRLKGADRKARVDAVMDFAKLHELRNRLTTSLSKGMKQRVALGRTLLHDPDLLILDEPADGLDPRARIELRELLRALADQGKAVFISSHILSELGELCDKCLIIEQGKLLAQGGVNEVLASHSGPPRQALILRLRQSTPELAQRAERVLLELPGILRVRLQGSELHVDAEPAPGAPPAADWADELASRVLRRLVQEELPVCGLELHQANLEDAFMSVTRGRVS